MTFLDGGGIVRVDGHAYLQKWPWLGAISMNACLMAASSINGLKAMMGNRMRNVRRVMRLSLYSAMVLPTPMASSVVDLDFDWSTFLGLVLVAIGALVVEASMEFTRHAVKWLWTRYGPSPVEVANEN